MEPYKYAFIDGNYILKRNGAAMSKGGSIKIEEDQLKKSFYSSIARINRELATIINSDIGFEKAILLFDRYPYRKSAAFPAYKGNRVYYTKDYIKEHYAELLEEGKLEEAANQADFNEKMMHVKYDILWHPEYNHKTLGIKGFEADDLAYLLAKSVENKPYKSIVISVDRDWNTFVNDNVDFITPPGGKWGMSRREDELTRDQLIASEFEVPIYELGILNELYNSSHNNIDVYKTIHPEIKYKDFCRAMYKGDIEIPDMDIYKCYYNAMNMNQYLEEFNNLDDYKKLFIE